MESTAYFRSKGFLADNRPRNMGVAEAVIIAECSDLLILLALENIQLYDYCYEDL